MTEYPRLKSSRLLYTTLVEEIEQMVVRGELMPGDNLPPQEQLATRFGVSRTVVREAVQILVARQLVTVQRGKGMVISHPSSSSVTESLSLLLKLEKATLPQLTELRTFIEPEMAALAALRSTPEEVRAIQTIESTYKARAKVDEESSPASPFQKYADLDVAIHQSIWDAAHNEVAKTVLESVLGLFRESMVATYSLDGALERTVKDHEGVIAAIAARDARAARRQMREHLDQVIRDQKSLVARDASNGGSSSPGIHSGEGGGGVLRADGV